MRRSFCTRSREKKEGSSRRKRVHKSKNLLFFFAINSKAYILAYYESLSKQKAIPQSKDTADYFCNIFIQEKIGFS